MISLIFSLLLATPGFADSLQDISNVLSNQEFLQRLDKQQDEWDLKFCIEHASFARQVVIPSCKSEPKSDCPDLLYHFYRAKCERWGL